MKSGRLGGYFPVVAVTEYHKLGGLKQPDVYPFTIVAKIKVFVFLVSLWRRPGKVCLCFFQLLEPLAAPASFFKASGVAPGFSPHMAFCFWGHILSAPLIKDTMVTSSDYPGRPEQPPHLNIFNLVIFAKFLLL